MNPCPFVTGGAAVLCIPIGRGARIVQRCIVLAVRPGNAVVFDFDYGDRPAGGRPLIARRRRSGAWETDGGAVLSESEEISSDLSKGT